MNNDQKNLFDEPRANCKRTRQKADSGVVFKRYNQEQMMLLPPDLSEMIPFSHMVRIVNMIIDGLNIEPLIATYQGGGTSAYHPKMMLKVLVYAYISKIYSSRCIAKALRQDIHFMWLSAMNRPDFRTINGFRSGRLKKVIDQVFTDTVMYLLDHNYIDFTEYFVDGTKLRADNNKHKVIWAKNTQRYKEMVRQKIREHLNEIDRLTDEENLRYGDQDLEEMGNEQLPNSEELKKHIQQINEKIQNKKPPKRCQTVIKELQKQLLPKLEKYEDQERLLAGRNSYAKTDPDATVFRSKDGQLLPNYNLILGTQNQFVINYTFHQRKASESDAFIPHMKQFRHRFNKFPMLAMGDCGIGSEENYAYLAKHEIGNYLKYNTFHWEKKKKNANNPYRKENFKFTKENDIYTCPQGRPIIFKGIKYKETLNGYKTTLRIYQCTNCDNCPVAEQCKNSEGPRSIHVNQTLDRFRKQARENLDSERGIHLRKKRSVDVEPPFGDIKFNQGYSRLRLRGLKKANVEVGLLAIVHNTKKIAFRKN